MTTAIRVRTRYQDKYYDTRFYEKLSPFLTLLQDGKFNTPNESYVIEFALMFEHKDWDSGFDPDLFQKTVTEQRDLAPRPAEWYQQPDAAMKLAIRDWRTEASIRISEVSFGLLG